MEKELTVARVEAEFVNAVDGRRVGPACAASLARRHPGRALSPAEAACAVSHRKAWRKFLRSGAPFALVLEDDVHLGRGLAEVLRSDWTRWRFDVVKFETKLEKGWLSRSGDAVRGDPRRSLRRLYSGHLGTAAYLVSAGGARGLLRLTRKFADPLDEVMFSERAVHDGPLAIFQLEPAIAVQDDLRAGKMGIDRTLDSTIGEARAYVHAKRNLSVLAKIAREVRRPLSRAAATIGRTIERLRDPDREWRVIEFE
jgi:glycosyl transferase family 25